MTHILAEQPELIVWVVAFAALVASVPYWGDLARFSRQACPCLLGRAAHNTRAKRA